MPSYNLTQPQAAICVSWIFEPGGYLDSSVNTAGQTARAALGANSTLDLTLWIRNNIMDANQTDLETWIGCAMIWWIWKNDQVNITPAKRPPETNTWVALLQKWDSSLVANPGNTTSVLLHAQDGSTFTQPANANRVAQRGIISGVLSVLT